LAKEESVGNFIEGITRLVADNEVQVRDLIQNPGSFMRRRELAELLVHERLVREVSLLPGSLIEIGVKFGNVLLFWNKLQEIYAPLDTTTMIFGFDSFQGYEPITHGEEMAVREISQHQAKLTCEQGTFSKISNLAETDSLMNGFKRVRLIVGNVEEVLKPFLDQNRALRFKLVHIDVNLFAPTALALRLLGPRIIIGGKLVVRSFSCEPWEGESAALEQFLQDNRNYELGKDPRSRYPTAILTKTDLNPGNS